MVRPDAPVELCGRAEDATGGEEGVAADGDGHGVGFVGASGSGGGGQGADEVAAEDDVRLDDGAAAEDDVRGAVDEGAAGDFVAGVLGGR